MTRILGRMLLVSAVAVVLLHGRAGADEESSLGRIPEFQRKLNERIEYKLTESSTLADELTNVLVGGQHEGDG